MKNLILSLAFSFFLGVVLFGQPAIQKGDFSIGGYAGIVTESTEGFSKLEISSQILGAYFIQDNLGLGAAFIYKFSGNSGQRLSKDLLFGQLVEYYHFLGASDKFALKGVGIIYYVNRVTLNQSSGGNGLGIAILPGISYFVNDNVAVNASLAFEYQLGIFRNDFDDELITKNSFIFGTPLLGLSIHL